MELFCVSHFSVELPIDMKIIMGVCIIAPTEF